ncbi:uncharacterized protein LOC132313894 [Cornus florida]|uniref:uncharacterized protein LOC132313894 n=1 Tax=Cornus florida TaxID=4283 RepID=UPI0028A0E9BD|nr:uncharacterized protein LOC132313894 [Cornus florida]
MDVRAFNKAKSNQQALMDVVRDLQEDVWLLKEKRSGGTSEDVYRLALLDASLVVEDDRDEEADTDVDDEDDEDDDDASGSDTDDGTGDDEEIPTSRVPFAGDDPDT